MVIFHKNGDFPWWFSIKNGEGIGVLHTFRFAFWGAAIGIFFLGFCLGGVTEYSGERAVRRFVKVRQYRRGAELGGWGCRVGTVRSTRISQKLRVSIISIHFWGLILPLLWKEGYQSFDS